MTLKSGNQSNIVKMFNTYKQDINDIVKSVIKLVYFMRGSVSYNEMMNMSYMERSLISEFISERLEQESKRPNPVY